MPFIKIGSTVGCMEIEKLVAITFGWGKYIYQKIRYPGNNKVFQQVQNGKNKILDSIMTG